MVKGGSRLSLHPCTTRLLNPGDVIICQRISGTNNIMFGNGVILAPGETMINGVRDISPMINNVSTWIEVWSSNTGITTEANIPLTGLPALIDIAEIGIVIGDMRGFNTVSVPVTVRDSAGNLQTRFSFSSSINTGYFNKNIIGSEVLRIAVAITSQTTAFIPIMFFPSNTPLFAIVYKRRL